MSTSSAAKTILHTGCTEDLKERFQRHTNGHVPATEHLLPVELIFYCAFKDKYKAFEFEKYLKSGSGRAFMYKRILWLWDAILHPSVKTTTYVK